MSEAGIELSGASAAVDQSIVVTVGYFSIFSQMSSRLRVETEGAKRSSGEWERTPPFPIVYFVQRES